MMAETKLQFSKEMVEKLSSRYSEDSLIKDRRLKALEIFHQLPEPMFKYGISIMLDISELNLNKINPLEISENDFVEIKADAKSGVIVEDIRKAIATIPEVRNHFMKYVSVDNKIDALTAAFWQKGTVIYVPKGTVLKSPIEIASKLSSGNALEYVMVIVESSSEVTIIEDISSEKNNADAVYFSGKIVEIVVKDNSIVHYASVQNLSRDYFNFVKKRAVVGANSTMNWLDCCLGSKYTRADIITLLAGRGAVTNNYGLFFGTGKQQFDLNFGTVHAERNTVCDMMTKGALNERAKAVYTGLVKIEANAAESNGYQKEDTLLLSPDAEADSIPQLEIDNNEVRCTHGATVGQVDKEKLFYLMSRGISEKQAKKIVVAGFFEPMILKISVESVQKKLREIVDEKIVIR